MTKKGDIFQIPYFATENIPRILLPFTCYNLYIIKGTSLNQTCKISTLTLVISYFILKMNMVLTLSYIGLLHIKDVVNILKINTVLTLSYIGLLHIKDVVNILLSLALTI